MQRSRSGARLEKLVCVSTKSKDEEGSAYDTALVPNVSKIPSE
jgi:hypothetical protein